MNVAAFINRAGFIFREPAVAQELLLPSIPMEVWFYGLPIHLSSAEGVSAAEAFPLIVSLVALVSAVMCLRVAPFKTRFELVTWAVCVALLYFVLPLMGRNMFGTREYMFCIGALPYLLLALKRYDGESVSRPVGVLIGILFGFGICCKPLLVAVFVAVEGVLLLANRSLRISLRAESLAAGLVGLGYLVAWLIFYPEFFSAGIWLGRRNHGLLCRSEAISRDVVARCLSASTSVDGLSSGV